jgi:type II secretory pathway pseudopilin PulG
MSFTEIGLLIAFAIMALAIVLGFVGLGPLVAKAIRDRKAKNAKK